MNKRFCVVLKADHEIGTGHLMRVKGVLRPLMDAGLEPCLAADSLDGSVMPLCSEYKEIIRFSKGDVQGFADAVKRLAPAFALFDHYFIGPELESPVRAFAKVAVVDDLERRHDCDLLTDSGFFKTGEEYRGKVPGECRLLCGERYSLIRPEFKGAAARRPARTRLRVLVNYGGADPAHACLRALKSVIAARLYEKYDFTVLSGISNPDHDELSSLASAIPQIEVLRSTSHVADLFVQCDMAMGAYGGMFKERMCAGLPALNTVIADNQKGGDRLVRRLGCGDDISLQDLGDPKILEAKLASLEANLEKFRQAGMREIGGEGIGLVSKALMELAGV